MDHLQRRSASIVFGLALVLVLSIPATAQNTGIIEGRVSNGTAGAAAVAAGLPVTLYAVQGGTEVRTLETTTDANGRFRFENLDVDPSLEFWPEVVYRDVTYRSDEPYQFDGEETTLTAPITVFETTDDDSDVAVDSVHFIAESFGQVLRISEIHLYGNRGDRTYVGQNGEDGAPNTLYIPLPENATGIAFEQEGAAERYLEVEGGIMDTEPVPPGQETSLAFFSYHLVVMGDTVPLVRAFAYPLTHLNVLVAQPGLMLNSDQLRLQGPESFQGRSYDLYTIDDLSAGDALSMEFVAVGMPAVAPGVEQGAATGSQPAAVPSTQGTQELLRWFGLGLAALAVVGVVVYATSSNRLPPASTARPKLSADPESRRLLAKLADLEDAFERGNVDQASYERQKSELREAIKSLNL
jgi:hypothetical protein